MVATTTHPPWVTQEAVKARLGITWKTIRRPGEAEQRASASINLSLLVEAR